MEIDPQTQAVIAEIRAAFLGVKLGEGIGLQEADGIDDREDEETLAALRAADEKEDWENIPAERLNRCFSSPGFLDPPGIRFHLPSFLIAELKGDYHQEIVGTLTNLDDWRRGKYILLNATQKQAVSLFLVHVRDNPDFGYQYSRQEIDQALEEFWQVSHL